jgi:GNAT superfamily N-acetyltransferase
LPRAFALKTQIALRSLQIGDREALAAVDGGNGWNCDAVLWSGYLADQDSGRRNVLVAWIGKQPVGYGNLLWQSSHAPFRHAGIPEINNIVVDTAYRRRGIATSLILALEEIAWRAGKSQIGLAVGLYAAYGAAQRLYWRLGYQPDGNGVTYDGRGVSPGNSVRVDDVLLLWLLKTL